MKRRQFIFTSVAGLPLLAAGSVHSSGPATGKAFKAKAGEGRFHGHILLKGVNANIIDVKVSGKDTDGALAIFEQTSQSQGRGTPLHVHPLQDEIFYVQEGNYFFQVGQDKHRLTAGDSIFLPRNVPHSWIQLSPRGKMTVTLQPAGKLEEFFVAMAALNHIPTPEEMSGIFAAHEMQVLGPPVTPD